MPSAKTLIIVRHAHRNKPFGRAADNGLSKKGRKQAKAVARFFLSRFSDLKPVILSSPKVRCVETVAPLAKAVDAEIVAVPELTEHGDLSKEETYPQFKKRIEKILSEQINSRSKVIILCSHGDWIPEALQIMTGNELSLDKAGWAEFEIAGNHRKMTWLIQGW